MRPPTEITRRHFFPTAPSCMSSATVERPAPIARQRACGAQRRKSQCHPHVPKPLKPVVGSASQFSSLSQRAARRRCKRANTQSERLAPPASPRSPLVYIYIFKLEISAPRRRVENLKYISYNYSSTPQVTSRFFVGLITNRESFETIWAPNRFGLKAKRFAPSRPWSHMRLHLLAMERVHGREYSWERKTLAPAAKDAVREAGGGVS